MSAWDVCVNATHMRLQEHSERLAVLERDMAALANENQRLAAEVDSLRSALHAAREGQPSALVQPGLEALPVSMASTPA